MVKTKKHPGGTEHAPAHFQIPSVVVPSMSGDGPLVPQELVHAFESLFDCGGALCPDIRIPSPREGVAHRRFCPPKCQSISQPAPEPRQRLEKMETSCERTKFPA